MAKYPTFRLGAVQAAPVFFDPDASTDKACDLIKSAAEQGVTLAAFGETWISGYPFFVGGPKNDLFWEASAEYIAGAISVPGPQTDQLCAAAREADIDVAIGVVERDPNTEGSVYCTMLLIGREGAILGRHRKLKPTHDERLIWAEGDAVGLRVHERAYGRISALNCFEHKMVLPGYALMSQGTQIHVAAWPGREPREPAGYLWPKQTLLSRAFAAQGACYVICAAGLRLEEHVPQRYASLVTFYHTGESCIIDPRGEIIAGPVEGETILVADGTLEAVYAAKAAFDVGGHYSRPDIFHLYVDNQPIERVAYSGQFDDSENQQLNTAEGNDSPES
jgi:predicted amidohydrolase